MTLEATKSRSDHKFYYLLLEVGAWSINPIGVFKTKESAEEKMQQLEKFEKSINISSLIGIMRVKYYEEENL